jgi:hypothetical protein
MPTFQTQTIRLPCNVNSKTNVPDLTTSAEPQAWWSCDLQIAAALFSDGGDTILDVSDLTSATLTLKDPTNMDGSPLFQQTIAAFDDTTTAANFDAGTNQHMLFTIPAASLSFTLTNGNPPQRLVQMSIELITTGGKTGVGAVSTLNVIDPGSFSPNANPSNAITVAQAQAMLNLLAWTQAVVALAAAGTTAILNAGIWLLGRAPLSAGAGAGVYVANITLSDANALPGALLRIPIDFAATLNPTINIYDATTGGTLLQTITNIDANARSFLFTAAFDGDHWHKESGAWVI